MHSREWGVLYIARRGYGDVVWVLVKAPCNRKRCACGLCAASSLANGVRPWTVQPLSSLPLPPPCVIRLFTIHPP